MLVELVQATAADGLRLDGALAAPVADSAGQLPCDGLVLLHGTGSNFYSSSLLAGLAEHGARLGLTVLRANTRGHDAASIARVGASARLQGAAFESFAESPLDVAALVELLVARGCRKIVGGGHSAGAVKAIYAQAKTPHPAVVGVLAISPPRLSYGAFLAGGARERFQREYERAETHVQAGEGDALLHVQFPLPMFITAAGYLEKYGPAESFDVRKLLPEVSVPTLVTLGGQELQRNAAFIGLDEDLRELPAAQAGLLRTAVVAGADHFYTNQQAELYEAVERWLRRPTPASGELR